MRDPIWPTWVVASALVLIAVTGPWNREPAMRPLAQPQQHRFAGAPTAALPLQRDDHEDAYPTDGARRPIPASAEVSLLLH